MSIFSKDEWEKQKPEKRQLSKTRNVTSREKVRSGEWERERADSPSIYSRGGIDNGAKMVLKTILNNSNYISHCQSGN